MLMQASQTCQYPREGLGRIYNFGLRFGAFKLAGFKANIRAGLPLIISGDYVAISASRCPEPYRMNDAFTYVQQDFFGMRQSEEKALLMLGLATMRGIHGGWWSMYLVSQLF